MATTEDKKRETEQEEAAKQEEKKKASETKKADPVQAPKKAPQWLTSVGDFLKMVFVTPFALVARVFQRLALGKEGAQHAQEMAEKESVKIEDNIKREKLAKTMEREVNEVLKVRESDPAYTENPLAIKKCEIYIPDNGRDDLMFAVNVTCQNDTRYGTGAEFAVYINQDKQLVASEMVPDEIVAQIKELLEKTELHVVDVKKENAPDAPSKDTEPETDGPSEEEHSDSEPGDATPPVITTTTAERSETEPGSVTCAFKGTTVVVKETDDPLKRQMTVNGKEYTCEWNGDAHAVKITAVDPAEKSFKEMDQVIVARAVRASYADIMADENKHTAGATCEAIVASAKSNPGQTQFFVVPDAMIAGKDMVVSCNPGNRGDSYIHIGEAVEENGILSVKQSEHDKTVHVMSNMATDPLIRTTLAMYAEAAGYIMTPCEWVQGQKNMYGLYPHEDQARAVLFKPVQSGIIGISDRPVPEEVLMRFAAENRDRLASGAEQGALENTLQQMGTKLSGIPSGRETYCCVGDIVLSVKHNEGVLEIHAHEFGRDNDVVVTPRSGDQRDITEALKEAFEQANTPENTLEDVAIDDNEIIDDAEEIG